MRVDHEGIRVTRRGITTSARLGTAIRLTRQDLGWTQAELAKRSGVARPQISAVETNRTDIKGSTLLKLLNALDCELIVKPVDRSVFQVDDYLDTFKAASDDRS